MEVWQIVLSSVVLASIVSSIFTLIINNFTQNKSFKNDYYKLVINKRMEAYQYIDNQLKSMKLTVLDDDAMPYHSMFGGDQQFIYANQHDLLLARANGIWLSDSMENSLSELNQLLFEINSNLTDNVNSNVVLAKKYYSRIVDTREKVENQLRKDMLVLYDVKGFLKEKKKSGWVEYQVKRQ